MKASGSGALERARRSALLILASLSGCIPLTEDTCTQGDNMSDPRLANGLEQDELGLFVRIQWDTGTGRGAELTDAYFAAVLNVGTPDSPLFGQNKQVSSAELSDERELTIQFDESVNGTFFADLQRLSFSLGFQDRRHFISCSHPGMEDSYLLDVMLTFDKNGEFVDAQIEQRKFFGPI